MPKRKTNKGKRLKPLSARKSGKGLTYANLIDGLKRGETVQALCIRYGANVSAVTHWRKSDPALDREVRELMAQRPKLRTAYRARLTQAEKAAVDVVEKGGDWVEQWIGHYKVSHSFTDACSFVGKKTSEVCAAITPDHTLFNQEFHDRYKECELEYAMNLRDSMRQAAIEGRQVSMQKFLAGTDLGMKEAIQIEVMPALFDISAEAREQGINLARALLPDVKGVITA